MGRVGMSDQPDVVVEWVESVRGLRLEAGDALVVKCSRRLTREHAEMIVERVRNGLGREDVRVLVLPPEMDVEVLKVML